MNKEQMTRLYNTMLQIETKGESTKIMADCLRYLEQSIQTAAQPVTTEEPATIPEE
jgi:hypothetical protein